MPKDTVCQGCTFYDSDCTLGILDNAKEAGVDVLDCWNEEGEFHVIPNRQCMYRRPQAWVDTVQKRFGKSTCLEAHASQEVQMKVTAFVLCDEKAVDTDAEKTLLDLCEQEIKPDCVVLVRQTNTKVGRTSLLEYIDSLGFPEWKIQNITNTDRVGRYAIELAMRWKPRPYYACFRAGKSVPLTFLSNLNERVNKHFLQFAIINNPEDDVHGVVVPRVVLQYYSHQFHNLELLLERDTQSCQGILPIQQVHPKFQ